MKAFIWIILAIIVIGGGWYLLSAGPSAAPTMQSTSTTTQSTGTTPVAAPTPTVSAHSDATLGTYLVASNGMTLYVDTKDKLGVSTCTGVCLANWPAYTVSSSATLVADTGVTGALGTIAGTGQVTYKGMPLYFWVKDTKPGDATGNKVGNFVLAKP